MGFPHSGQNFGAGCDGSGSYPQDAHFNCEGFDFPQFEQNLPVFSFPHEHFHVETSGFGLPQFEQNLPVFSFPQEHFQLPGTGCAAVARAASLSI